MSHNYFTELEFDASADVWDCMPVLKMSDNNASELKVPKLEELINMKKLFLILVIK